MQIFWCLTLGFETNNSYLLRISDYVLNYCVVWIGYTRDEVLGRNCRFLGGRNTDDSALQLVIHFFFFFFFGNLYQCKWIMWLCLFLIAYTDKGEHQNWKTMHSTYFELQVNTSIHFYLCGQSFEFVYWICWINLCNI